MSDDSLSFDSDSSDSDDVDENDNDDDDGAQECILEHLPAALHLPAAPHLPAASHLPAAPQQVPSSDERRATQLPLYTIVGDNIDKTVKPRYMRAESQGNNSLHYFHFFAG